MESPLRDLFRRNEILAFVLNGVIESKSDYAERYGVAEITINRDLQWLRKSGIQIYSKNNKVLVIEKPKTEVLLNLASNYLPLKLKSELFHNTLKTFLHSGQNKGFEYLVLISKAILDKTIIRMHYKRFYDNETAEYDIRPIELTEKNKNWIMSGVKFGETDIKMFYLSRVKKLEVTNKSFQTLNLNKAKSKKENIVLRFSADVADQVTDKIWFDDFKLEKESNGDFLLKTSHEINNSLAAWCISWWDKIEIVEPKVLKHFISEMIKSFNLKN